jgi:hypothetical protein
MTMVAVTYSLHQTVFSILKNLVVRASQNNLGLTYGLPCMGETRWRDRDWYHRTPTNERKSEFSTRRQKKKRKLTLVVDPSA